MGSIKYSWTPHVRRVNLFEDYAHKNYYSPIRHFTDGGVSATTVDREGFGAMIAEVEAGNIALLYRFASGWGVCVAVHGFSTGYYKFKESWGLEHDKE